MKFISLYAGIGGIDLGFERAGMQCVAQVEKDPYRLQVLARHWPDVPRWTNDEEVGKHNLPPADLICGGFPCQPFSSAGQRRGEGDARNRWPQMRRVIAEMHPAWVVAENVPGIIGLYLDVVLDEIEAEGYEVGAFVFPVASLGAPHLRHRVWILAHARSGGREAGSVYQANWPESEPWRQGFIGEPSDSSREAFSYPEVEGLAQRGNEFGQNPGEDCLETQPGSSNRPSGRGSAGQSSHSNGQPSIGVAIPWEEYRDWPPEPRLGRLAHGVPHRVERIRALGDAVSPVQSYHIGRLIMQVEEATHDERQG